MTLKVANGQQLQGYSVQLVQHQGSVKGKGVLSCVPFMCLCTFISKSWESVHHRSVVALKLIIV